MKEKTTYQELEHRVRELERAAAERRRSEGALREITDIYHLHFSLANDVLYSVDTQLRIMSASPSIEKVLGYKPEELVGKHIQDLKLLHPECLDKAMTDTLQVFSGKKIASSIYEFITKDGVRKFGEVRGVPLMRNGNAVAVVAVARDITRRIEMEKTLRESEEKYDIHFSLANDVIYAIDEGLKITSISPSIGRILGYRPEELVGKPIRDLKMLHQDDIEKALSEIRQVLSGGKINCSVYQFVAKDGSRVFGEVSGVPLVRDGKAVSVISVARDITERIEMEKSLRESEERFRTIFESARDCIYIKNLDLKYVFVNPFMEKLFRLTSQDILAHGDKDLFRIRRGANIRQSDLRVIGGEVVEEECTRTVGGTSRTFHVIKVPMRDSAGTVTGLCGIARDITERKRTEEELLVKERELASQARYLEDMNIALKVLLDSREKEKKQEQEGIVLKARKIIYPYLEKMEAVCPDGEARVYLGIIRANLEELLLSCTDGISLQYLTFTPTEVRIADLIKQGKTSKEIASLLRITPFAVSFHRGNIRKKCGLLNSKKNLMVHLHDAEHGQPKTSIG